MEMVPPWGLLLKANPLAPRKLPRFKLKPMPYWRVLKLSWRLRKLRCEGVEFSVVEHKFCKNILAQLRHRIFHEVEWFFLCISFAMLMFVLLHLFTWII
jgi:hypothetical protein